jgi:hypothetical protein
MLTSIRNLSVQEQLSSLLSNIAHDTQFGIWKNYSCLSEFTQLTDRNLNTINMPHLLSQEDSKLLQFLPARF